MEKVIITVVGIIAAVSVSAIVFIGINKIFDLAPRRWTLFSSLIGGVSSLIVFGLLWGNRLIDQPVTVTLVAGVIGTGAGYALSRSSSPSIHLAIGATAGVLLGGLIGIAIKPEYFPRIEPITLLVSVVVGLAVGAGIWIRGGRTAGVARPLLLWGSIGWLFGAWLFPTLGSGTRVEATIAAVVLGIAVGAWVGSFPLPDQVMRRDIAFESRKYIFLAPALGFILMTLVVPLIRTMWLSLLTGTPTKLEWTGLSNYGDIATDPGIIDFSGWTDVFTSRLLWVGAVALIIGMIIARLSGRRLGQSMAVNGGSLSAMAFGFILVGFAVFAVIRGTISNNLWWIFAVTIFSTGMGLAIAVLTDRSKGENIAKSMIFMPMAISFVGASIIWRFMYIARPPQKDQTGVMNFVWVKLGEWSNSSTATAIVVTVLGLILIGVLYIAWRGTKARVPAITGGAVVAAIPLAWLIYRFLGPGLGGFQVIEATGQTIGQPILFLQESPFNNFWMMVVLIWIQTGFAMVILSAAIKAVPAELIEASRIDGATDSQVFWRITIPQVSPTIGVVVTTLIVTVLKVFDIPKVMTNGNFDTQVLANEMWQRAFTELDFGLGSAIAVVLFLGVLPIMWINIRRMQKQRAAT
ncbi:MAG: sugar ABC transporter permease [Actinomycetota bacterium]|nr:sugar ABC transporter permease [Actinomycetota bacterium]